MALSLPPWNMFEEHRLHHIVAGGGPGQFWWLLLQPPPGRERPAASESTARTWSCPRESPASPCCRCPAPRSGRVRRWPGKYSGSTCPGNPGCFWSRFTARMSKWMGGGGGAALQVHQNIQQGGGNPCRPTAHHHPVARFDHSIVVDGFTHLGSQKSLQLFERL